MYTVCTDTKMYTITDSTVYALTHNCTTSLYVQCMHWQNPIHHHSKYNVCTDTILYMINTNLNCLKWQNTVHGHSTFIVCTDTILYTSTLRKLYALTQYCTPAPYVSCMHWHNTVHHHSMYTVCSDSAIQHHSMYIECTDTVVYNINLCTQYALTQYCTPSLSICCMHWHNTLHDHTMYTVQTNITP